MPEPLTQIEVLSKLARSEPFGGAEIGDVDFRDYAFKKKINFSGAIFTGIANFAGVKFLNGAYFGGAKFTGKEEANFANVTFSGNGEVEFEDVQFSSGVNFFKAKFSAQYGANFSGVSLLGKGTASFRHSEFFGSGDVNFSYAKFSSIEGVDFSYAKFSGEGEVNFSWAIFSSEGEANFRWVLVSNNGGMDFRGAKFSNLGGVDFSEAKFSNLGGVDFSGTKFSGERGVSFGGAKFSSEGRINFRRVTFSGKGETNFRWAQFSNKGGTEFGGARFSSKGGTFFNRTQFLGPGKTRFEKTFFDDGKMIFFTYVEIKLPETLEFVDVSSLRNTIFLYTDLEKISFKNARFCQTQNKFFNREYLTDEVRNEIVTSEKDEVAYDQDYYSQVEILYRKLKLNFESQLDFHRAGDFHYGELEMRRKAKMLDWDEKPISKYLPLLKYFNLTQCYKIVSGYGEKWVQALASFIAVWMVFTGFNLFWVEPVIPQEQPAQMETWKQDSLHRLGGTALFSFKVLTLQRWGDEFQLTGTSYFPRFFVSVQHLIGPTVIALMLLAIRRQFRR